MRFLLPNAPSRRSSVSYSLFLRRGWVPASPAGLRHGCVRRRWGSGRFPSFRVSPRNGILMYSIPTFLVILLSSCCFCLLFFDCLQVSLARLVASFCYSLPTLGFIWWILVSFSAFRWALLHSSYFNYLVVSVLLYLGFRCLIRRLHTW